MGVCISLPMPYETTGPHSASTEWALEQRKKLEADVAFMSAMRMQNALDVRLYAYVTELFEDRVYQMPRAPSACGASDAEPAPFSALGQTTLHTDSDQRRA